MVDFTLDVAAFVGFLATGLSAAYIGGRFTSSSLTTWYANLRKPSWTPPGWFIGLMWSILYPAMSIAAWLVWRERGLAGAGLALALYAVQLAVNVAWSYAFFWRRSPGLGFAAILVMWLAILATLVLFYEATPLAGWLFVPYLGWVTVASALNGTVWRMNRPSGPA